MKANNILEILYNNFDRLDESDLVIEEFFIKYKGEMVPIANMLNEKYRGVFDNIKNLSKTSTRFVMTYQDTMIKASTELSGSALKVLWYLISKMKFQNCVYGIKYSDIQLQFSMSYGTITKAVSELKKKNYIKVDGKRTNLVYHISPAVCWKGSVYSMHKKLKMFTDEDE